MQHHELQVVGPFSLMSIAWMPTGLLTIYAKQSLHLRTESRKGRPLYRV